MCSRRLVFRLVIDRGYFWDGSGPKAQKDVDWADSLAQRARNKCPPKSALKARDNSARRGPSNIGVTSSSIPYVSFIERDPIPFQKQSKFVFEGHCSVVFFLGLLADSGY